MSTAERKERERLRRRNEIIDAAERLFFSKGLENVTMDDIARDTELARGTLYLYFRNKDEILVAIAVRGVKVLNRLFKEAFQKGDTGIAKIRHLLYALYDLRVKYPGYYSMIWYLQGHNIDRKDYPEMEELLGIHGDNSRMVLESFNEGMKDGTLSGDLDPVKTSMFFTAAMQSVINIAPSTDIQDEYVNYSIGLMLRAIENAS
jgi:TetR/AcrR family transcriptional regulator